MIPTPLPILFDKAQDHYYIASPFLDTEDLNRLKLDLRGLATLEVWKLVILPHNLPYVLRLLVGEIDLLVSVSRAQGNRL